MFGVFVGMGVGDLGVDLFVVDVEVYLLVGLVDDYCEIFCGGLVLCLVVGFGVGVGCCVDVFVLRMGLYNFCLWVGFVLIGVRVLYSVMRVLI